MERDQVVSIFNKEFAADYDRRNARLAAFRDANSALGNISLLEFENRQRLE